MFVFTLIGKINSYINSVFRFRATAGRYEIQITEMSY